MKGLLNIITVLIAFTLSAQSERVTEEVFLHANSSFLLSGETLYYSAYINQAGTGLPSSLSKILYVELVGEDNQRPFQQKLLITNGRASGEFFVPTLVSTGSYQLVAYTRWMKNFETFFNLPVTIVNPFEKYELPEANGLSIEFFQQGGGMVPNRVNEVKAKVYQNSKPHAISGRIVNTEGTKISDFKSDKNGIAIFDITPSENQKYQLIVENEAGEFEFFNLPNRFTEHSLKAQEYSGFFQFQLISKGDGDGLLQVFDGEELILEKRQPTNQPFRVSKDNFKTMGPFLATYENAQLVFGTFYDRPKIQDIGTFPTRSKVQIPMNTSGSFSVSVSKVNESRLPTSHEMGLRNRTNSSNPYFIWTGQKRLPHSIKFLPETRGELISGKVEASLAGEKLLFSTIDTLYQIRSGEIKEDGTFSIQIDPMFADKKGFLTVLNVDSTSAIATDNPFMENYDGLSFPAVILDSAQAADLAKRSIKNQIENAYYKPQITFTPSPILPYQFDPFPKSYVLDDYNRFPKMYEHFIEFVPEVVARQNKNRSKLKVLLKYMMPTDLPPLILIDGLPTTPEDILSFSPYKIKSIHINQSRLFLGPLVADGMVSFQTFTGDLYGFKPGKNSLTYDYQGLEPLREYEFPNHENSPTDETPDYRRQLYWKPDLTINNTDQIEFFTSDLTGDFELSIEGFNTAGAPVSIHKTFTVKANSPASN